MQSDATSSATELQTTAARMVLGLIHSWEVPPIADRALNSGIYSPSLAELTMMSTPIMSDVAPLLERAIAELGIQRPSRAAAAWIVVRYCMERIVAETECPRAALGLLADLSLAAGDVAPDSEYAGQGLDIGFLVGIFYSYDESVPDDDLDQEARSEAREWLERHPT